MAYEISEGALRASLVYNSQRWHDNLTGTVNLTQLLITGGNPFLGRNTLNGSAGRP